MKSRAQAGSKNVAGPRQAATSLAPLDGAAKSSGAAGLKPANAGQAGLTSKLLFRATT